MNQQLTSQDILAQMMADAKICNRRMVKDTINLDACKPREGTLRSRILSTIDRNGWTSRETLSDELGISRKYASVEAGKLVATGDLERRYVTVPGRSGQVVQWRVAQ